VQHHGYSRTRVLGLWRRFVYHFSCRDFKDGERWIRQKGYKGRELSQLQQYYVDGRHLVLYSIPMPDDEHFEATLGQWTFEGQTRLNERCTLSVLNLSDSLVIVHAPNLGTLIVVSCYLF
jgi:hypothetical protein